MAKNFNPTFSTPKAQSAKGYSAFPLDHLVNFTSAAGYLIPVYWDFLDPGDKVNLQTLLRTKSQPLSKPAMATCIERVEWFAVPIDQLFKPFSAKFYGINDVASDLLPTKGYNDYLPFISLRNLNERLISLPVTPETQTSVPSLPLRTDSMRLCHALGLPKNFGVSSGYFPASISLLPFAAYQKIYSDHYRLTDREENDPASYNLDSLNGGSGGSSAELTSSSRIDKLITLRKRPYMRDYFTSMQVSPLMGSQDVNASGNDLGKINQWLNGLSNVASGIPSSDTNFGYIATSNTNPTTVRLPGQSANTTAINLLNGTFNPANIRSLFAVEKLLEVTRRAKKHYDMQTLAHFGVDVPKGLSGECMKIGTHEQYLNIGEVISTANTTDGSLGELAGRGNSEGKSSKFSFEAKCHCVLMAIYSVEPVVNISNDGLPRLLTMTNASDFYKSEFDNLGLQPVFRRELKAPRYATLEDSNSHNYNDVIGWQPRYEQLKGRYNRSFAGCSSSYFQEWALNRTPILDTGSNVSRNFFYVWPTDLNNILLVPYTMATNATTIYSEDYFINQIYFDVTKSSKKSIFGVPNL